MAAREWQMSDRDVRAFRVAHAQDLCGCSHSRSEHYARLGATVGCRSCRGCSNYHRAAS